MEVGTKINKQRQKKRINSKTNINTNKKSKVQAQDFTNLNLFSPFLSQPPITEKKKEKKFQ